MTPQESESLLADPVVAHGNPQLSPADDAFVASIRQVLSRLSARRQRELRTVIEVESRFGRIFQDSPVAFAMSTIDDGRMIDVNERWLDLFGYQRDQVIGHTNADLNLSADSVDRRALAQRVRTLGVLRDVEAKVRRRSGELIDVLVSAVAVDAGDSGADVWLSAVVDITDRKRAAAEREQLLASEQAARAEAEQAIEKLRAIYAITDAIPANSSLGELLGDLLGRLRGALHVDNASVLLLDEERKALYLRAIDGPQRPVPLPTIRVPLGAGVAGRIAAEGRAMIVDDYSQIDSSMIQASDPDGLRRTTSVMGAPFKIGDRVAGVVMASSNARRQFTQEELRLLLVAADRVGPAIERGRLIERIRSGVQRQRNLSRRLLTAHEEERRRLAVELHDELGQVLTAVKISLESLARPVAGAEPFTSMQATIQTVDAALLRVRDMALDLRPSVLDDLGLAAALRWFAHRFSRGGRIVTHVSVDVLPSLEPELGTACFRVAQEALTNVDRHSKAGNVWIDLHVLDGALELSVRDDGVGFDVAAARARALGGASVGLLGMQERVALADGELEIVQVPTGGTEIRARFPLAAGATP